MKISIYKKNIYTKEALLASDEVFKNLRELGEVVYLSKHNLYAVTSYDGVKKALSSPDILISGRGVTANKIVNSIPQETTLQSDGTVHRKRKGILMQPLSPLKMKALKATITTSSEQLIQDLLQKKKFEVINDFAAHLPLSIVSNLVGLGDEAKTKMLEWAFAGFNAIGPLNWRTIKSLPKLVFGVRNYALNLSEENVQANSWAAGIFNAVKNGKLSLTEGQNMIIDYTIPSLDTTILAAGNLFKLLAQYPLAFDEVRANPALIPGVINEVVRLSSPIRGFTRYVNADFLLNGYTLPKGERALILYASANRDTNKYDNPDAFDIHRNPKDQMGWGHGVHACAGTHLARLELEELLSALCKYTERLEVGSPTYIINNVLQGLKAIPGKLIAQ